MSTLKFLSNFYDDDAEKFLKEFCAIYISEWVNKQIKHILTAEDRNLSMICIKSVYNSCIILFITYNKKYINIKLDFHLINSHINDNRLMQFISLDLLNII